MKIEYIKELIISNYDGCDENCEVYYAFHVDDALKYILEIHLNSDYGTYRNDNFGNINRFPKNHMGDMYIVIMDVLTNLHEEIHFYYNKALKTGKDFGIKQVYRDNFSNIKIKFDNSDYLSFEEALNKIQTIFLQYIPKNILFTFTKSLIFDSNFRMTPSERLLKQKDELKNMINYSAFIYFIQIDLLKITMDDLNYIKEDLLGWNFRLNPFFDQKTKVIDEVSKIFKNFKTIQIKEGKYIQKKDRLKRIYDVYIMTQYANIYFGSENKSGKYHRIIVELRKLGYIFTEYYLDDTDLLNTADTAPYNSHIRSDEEIIENIKKITLIS